MSRCSKQKHMISFTYGTGIFHQIRTMDFVSGDFDSGNVCLACPQVNIAVHFGIQICV